MLLMYNMLQGTVVQQVTCVTHDALSSASMGHDAIPCRQYSTYCVMKTYHLLGLSVFFAKLKFSPRRDRMLMLNVCDQCNREVWVCTTPRGLATMCTQAKSNAHHGGQPKGVKESSSTLWTNLQDWKRSHMWCTAQEGSCMTVTGVATCLHNKPTCAAGRPSRIPLSCCKALSNDSDSSAVGLVSPRRASTCKWVSPHS